MRNGILMDYGVSTQSATKMRLKCVTIVGSFEQHILRNTSGKPMTAVTRGKKKTSAGLSICGYLGPEVIRDYGRWMKSTERTDFRTMRRRCAYVRLFVCVYICVCLYRRVDVDGSSAKQTRFTALIAVIPSMYVVSCRIPLSWLSPMSRPSPNHLNPLLCRTFWVIRVRSICAVRDVRLYALTCAHVFVLARGWIVTTAGDTRLNTPTIVTTDAVFPLHK